jgi:hypothetical protein
MASQKRWFFRRSEEKLPEEPAKADVETGDLPRVVTTNAYGRWPDAGGGVRLGAGGRSGIRAGDLTDLILPMVLVVGALVFTNRSCSWHAERYVPAVPIHASTSGSATVPSLGGAGRGAAGAGQSQQAGSATAKAADSGPKVDVVLEVEVGADGTTRAITVVRGAGIVADQLAIAKASAMQFEPRRRGGVPVATRMKITVSVPLG